MFAGLRVKVNGGGEASEEAAVSADPALTEPLAMQFVGGTVLQVFFSALAYHRYHSPASGTVVSVHEVPGVLFAISGNPDDISLFNDLPNNYSGFGANYSIDAWLEYGQNGIIATQVYLPHIANRCIFVLNNSKLGLVAFFAIGMTEISSCTIRPNIKVGAFVEAGEELGQFDFGGSSGAIVLQRRVTTMSAKACNGKRRRAEANLAPTDIVGPALWSVQESTDTVSTKVQMGEVIMDLRCGGKGGKTGIYTPRSPLEVGIPALVIVLLFVGGGAFFIAAKKRRQGPQQQGEGGSVGSVISRYGGSGGSGVAGNAGHAGHAGHAGRVDQ
jgi:hypothetical protein